MEEILPQATPYSVPREWLFSPAPITFSRALSVWTEPWLGLLLVFEQVYVTALQEQHHCTFTSGSTIPCHRPCDPALHCSLACNPLSKGLC